MSCMYCQRGETAYCDGLTSTSYGVDESASLEIDRDYGSMTVRTWIGDDESVDAEFQIDFCPFCGGRITAAEGDWDDRSE